MTRAVRVVGSETHIGEPHERLLDEATIEARDDSNSGADEEARDVRHYCNGKRDPGSVGETRQLASTQRIAAEDVARRAESERQAVRCQSVDQYLMGRVTEEWSRQGESKDDSEEADPNDERRREAADQHLVAQNQRRS